MNAEKLTRPRRTERTRESPPTAEPESTSRDFSVPRDGWSLARTFDDDTKRSMQAVGQVCRAAVIGVLLCGLGGVATLLGFLFF